MRFALIPAVMAMALAGCGGGGSVNADANEDGTITEAEMREAVADAREELKPEPGKYSVAVELIEIDIPGAPVDMQQMMGGMVDRSSEYCLTEEAAARGYQDSIKDGYNEACSITTFTIEGGDVDMALSCADDSGFGEMAVTMNGQVTPTTSDMTVAMAGTAPGMGEMNMKMSFKQERIGACD